MTELELAVSFVRVFADAVVTAARTGERLDEREELRRYCDLLGVEETPERLDLARDVALVQREHFRRHEESTSVDPDDLNCVPQTTLADGLEQHGGGASS